MGTDIHCYGGQVLPYDIVHRDQSAVEPARLVLSDSANIPAGGTTPTTFQLDPPPGKTSGSFQAGEITDDTNPFGAINLGASLYTEMEACFKAVAGVAMVGETFEFKFLSAARTPLDNYPALPRMTLATPSGSTVDVTGTGFGLALGGAEVATLSATQASGLGLALGGVTAQSLTATAASGLGTAQGGATMPSLSQIAASTVGLALGGATAKSLANVGGSSFGVALGGATSQSLSQTAASSFGLGLGSATAQSLAQSAASGIGVAMGAATMPSLAASAAFTFGIALGAATQSAPSGTFSATGFGLALGFATMTSLAQTEAGGIGTSEGAATAKSLAATAATGFCVSAASATTASLAATAAQGFGLAIGSAYVRSGSPAFRTITVTGRVDTVKSLTGKTAPPTSGSSLRSPTAASTDGTAVDWVNPGNVFALDGIYATATVTSGSPSTSNLVASGFGFAVPANATILGIKVEINKARTGGAVAFEGVRLRKAGVAVGSDLGLSADWPTTDTYQSYGGAANLWGTAWTPVDINNSGFGAAISAVQAAGGPALRIDHVRITVFWSLPPMPLVTGALGTVLPTTGN